jgi:DNA-directed RNA polymerase subunit alpha
MLDAAQTRLTAESEESPTRARFTVEPLDRGFGYTFGNSLRRVLLSSLEGAAVATVRIEGVMHEFSSVAGVKEDVTDIILNLKNVICRLEGEQDEVEVDIRKRGAGVLTAGDIAAAAPSGLEILNPELEIAHLDGGADLEITVSVRRGRGYAPADQNKSDDQPIGVIPIDSIFSPIRKVSYAVDSARVGQRTDYDKLSIDLSTDGSIAPGEALAEAAKILIERLRIFIADGSIEDLIGGLLPAGLPEEVPGASTTSHGMSDVLIEELELGVRSYNCLKRVGIETVGDLITKSEDELAQIPNFGKKSIEEVKENLASHGLSLRG